MRTSLLTILGALTLSLLLVGCGDDYRWAWEADDEDDEDEQTSLTPDNPGDIAYEDGLAGIPISNLSTLVEGIHGKTLHDIGYRGQNTTIAILDNGFIGLQGALGVTLPPDLAIEGDGAMEMAFTEHGTKLAELVYAVATGSSRYRGGKGGPQLKLLVTNGPYGNLEKAVDYLVEYRRKNPKQTLIALYSQIWEYGGNLDGRGYINNLVDRAVNAGVIWVNAAGNLGKSAYVAKVEVQDNGYVKLPHQKDYLRFSVTSAGTPVKLVLAWKDFTNSYYNYRTSQDLDLILENDKGEEIGRANLVQDGLDHGNTKGFSRHAREVIFATLAMGVYHVKVKANSRNFDDKSLFWVTASGPGVAVEGSNGHEHVFIPADNPRVLTVGGSDVDYGNSLLAEDGRVLKPDVLTLSKINYKNDQWVHGTSTAAAVAVGALALFRSAYGAYTMTELQGFINDGLLTGGVRRNALYYQVCQQPNPPSDIRCDLYRKWQPPELKLPEPQP